MRRALALAFTIASLFGQSVPAQADVGPAVLGNGVCLTGITLPVGETLVLRAPTGWAAANRGLVEDFRHGVATLVKLNDVALVHADSYWSAPEPIALAPYGDIWRTRWIYHLPLTAPGTIDVTWRFTFDHPLLDLLTFDDGSNVPFFWQAGTVSKTRTCHIIVR